MQITNLKVESAVNPFGIDVLLPRFSWQIETKASGTEQSVYNILVAYTLKSNGIQKFKSRS